MLSKVTPFARCRGLQEAVHQVKDLQRRCLPLPPWECACVEDEPVVVRSLEALVKCEAGFLLLKEISCRVVRRSSSKTSRPPGPSGLPPMHSPSDLTA